jgi:hypothetical protein
VFGGHTPSRKLAKYLALLDICESDAEVDIRSKLAGIMMRHTAQVLSQGRTEELLISSMGGATKNRTFSSESLYFAFPRTTCFPGAPVRWPPGRYACRVPDVPSAKGTRHSICVIFTLVIIFISALRREWKP